MLVEGFELPSVRLKFELPERSLLLEVLAADVEDVAIDRVQVILFDYLNLNFPALLLYLLLHARVRSQRVSLGPNRLGQTENGLVVKALLLAPLVMHFAEGCISVKFVVLLFVGLLGALGLAELDRG